MEFAHQVKSLLENPSTEMGKALNQQVRFNELVGIQEIHNRHNSIMRSWLNAFERWANLPVQYWDTKNRCSAGEMPIDLTIEWRGCQKTFRSIYKTQAGGINLDFADGGCYTLSRDGSDTTLKFALSDLLGFECAHWKREIEELNEEYSRHAAAAIKIAGFGTRIERNAG